MKKPKTAVLVDYRWVLYRSAFRFSEFVVEEDDAEIRTGCIYGILEFVKTVLDSYDNCTIYFCLDGKPVYRESLFPEYKAKRHEGDPVPEIACARRLHDEPIKILSHVPNVQFVQDLEREADDLMSILSFKELGLGRKPIIFSGDKDLLQLQQFGVEISKSIEDGRLQLLDKNYITLHKDFEVAPDELLYLRALDGDKSDGIPASLGGNRDLKTEFAIKWAHSGDKYLEHFEDLLEQMEPVIQELFKGKKAQENNRERLKTIKEDAVRNMKLMELDIYKPLEEAYRKYKEDKDKEALNKVKEQFKIANIQHVDYDLTTKEVKQLLDKYDMNRMKAWMNYNNYI